MNEKWDSYIETIAGLISNREHYQRTLGQVALEIRKAQGMDALKGLVEDLKERHGLTISWRTLHNYSWVEDRLADFELPEDIPYRLRQLIAGTPNPKEWVDKVNAGATTAEIFIAVRGNKPRPLIECPACHHAFERPSYIDARKKAIEETKDFQY
jgi:hypothetical protein